MKQEKIQFRGFSFWLCFFGGVEKIGLERRGRVSHERYNLYHLIFGNSMDVPEVPYQKAEFVQAKHAP